MTEQKHKIVRDYLLIAVIVCSYPFTWWRSRDRITATQAHELVEMRDAHNEVRDDWLNALTVAYCDGRTNPALCSRDWSGEMSAASSASE